MRVSYVLALLAAAVCANAAYGPSQTTKIAEQGSKEDEIAPVAFRYYVEPSKRKDFIKLWQKHEDSTTKEKDVVIFDLKFPMENNAEFLGYGEWKSMRAYAEHYESDHTQDFLDQLNKMDVAYSLEILKHPGVGELRHNPSRGETKGLAHVIIKYHVKPSAHKAFLDAWAHAEEGTESEKGARIYSLRRVVASNTEYYAYGTWSNLQEYAEHFKSDHVQQLLQTLNKHDIIYHQTPLVKVGGQPE